MITREIFKIIHENISKPRGFGIERHRVTTKFFLFQSQHFNGFIASEINMRFENWLLDDLPRADHIKKAEIRRKRQFFATDNW